MYGCMCIICVYSLVYVCVYCVDIRVGMCVGVYVVCVLYVCRNVGVYCVFVLCMWGVVRGNDVRLNTQLAPVGTNARG